MWAPCWTNSRLPAFALGARPWCQGPEQQLGGHLVSGLDGCESFAFPSADGSDGQSELKMFLIFDHCWRISMIRFRCFSTGTSYHPPTIHLPFGKSRRQDQRMLGVLLLTDGGDTINYAGAVPPSASAPSPAVSPGEACQIQQCQISQAQMDAELYILNQS